MFSYFHYIDTCNKYKENGYKFCNLGEKIAKNGKNLYMVHDIDLHIENAERLSLIENKNNINSTYFVRLSALTYNIFNESYKLKIKKIIDNGHSIGLHFERTFKNRTLKNDILFCKEILSEIIEYDVKYFNIHEPVRTGIDISKLMTSQNRCYNSEFFKNVKYLSDSGGRWREGCFSNHINKHKDLLVLTHPFYWYENKPQENY